MKDKAGNRTAGFSLVEMLIVMAIISVLIAIAIPQFFNYRKSGFEAQVKEDLRNAATAQEAYFADNRAYKSGALTSGTPPGYNRSAPITMTALVAGSTFTLTATHASCLGVSWSYSSVNGVMTGSSCP